MLEEIVLSNFRNYQNLSIKTDSDIIILYGDNGQGKTNFLEAIYFLAYLRSFRSNSIKSLKKIGSNGFHISGKISGKNSWVKNVDINYYNFKRRLLIDNIPILKSSDFIRHLKPIIFSHEDINIITGASKFRRKYLDILISAIDEKYFKCLSNYSIALKSRNILLRKRCDLSSITAFENIMSENAEYIINKRLEILETVKVKVKFLLKEIKKNNINFDI